MLGYVLDDQRIGVRCVVGGGIFLLTTAFTSTLNPMYPLLNTRCGYFPGRIAIRLLC